MQSADAGDAAEMHRLRLRTLPPDTGEMHPAFTPARQADTRSTYPEGMEG